MTWEALQKASTDTNRARKSANLKVRDAWMSWAVPAVVTAVEENWLTSQRMMVVGLFAPREAKGWGRSWAACVCDEAERCMGDKYPDLRVRISLSAGVAGDSRSPLWVEIGPARQSWWDRVKERVKNFWAGSYLVVRVEPPQQEENV